METLVPVREPAFFNRKLNILNSIHEHQLHNTEILERFIPYSVGVLGPALVRTEWETSR